MKKSTWIVLVVFLALVGLMVYLNQKDPSPEASADTTPTVPPEYLLSETDGTPVSIEITSQDGNAVRLARSETGLWAIEKPFKAEADQASAEAAASQLSSLKIISKPNVAVTDVGLVSPVYSLLIQFADGGEKTFLIGDATPTGSGYYAQIAGIEDIIIIDINELDVVLSLLAFPPYLNTPTPSPLPTETPTTATTATPEAAVSSTSTP